MCLLLLASLAISPAILAERLDHRDYHTRESAGRQLEALGEAAVSPLKQVIATGSPEAVRRAESLLRRITARLKNEKAIAPTLVTLDFRDAGFGAVVDAIRKQTGYKLEIAGDVLLARKKVTIRVTNRPFWEAVESLKGQLDLSVLEVRDTTVSLRVRLDDAMGRRLQVDDAVRLATDTAGRLVEPRIVRVALPARDPPPPSFNARVVRIEAVQFPNGLKEVSAEVIPLVLKLVSEPGTRLEFEPEVRITKAVTTDGTRLAQESPFSSRFDPSQSRISGWSFRGGSRDTIRDPRLGTYWPWTDGIAILTVPPRGTVTKLAVVEGVVRGELWRAGRKHQVELPFKLTDVPVAAGTRDPKAAAKIEQ